MAEIITILKEAVKAEYPNYTELSLDHKKNVIRSVISGIIDEVIKKIKLPKPPDPFGIRREQYLDARRSPLARRRRKHIDYGLWNLLYYAKLEQESLSSPAARTASFEEMSSDYNTFGEFSFSNMNDTMSNIQLSDSTVVKPKETFVYFDMDHELEKQMMKDNTLSRFISCIESNCRDQTGLGDIYCKLYSKKDYEIPNWNKIVLEVNFHEDDFDALMDKWESLRHSINLSFKKIQKEIDIDHEKLEKYTNDFYIKLKS